MTSTNLSPITLSISSSFLTFNSQSHFLTQISKTPLKSTLICNKTNLNQQPTAMEASSISGDCQLPISTHQFKPFQLDDAADFFMISSPLGFISICGFGSLLSGEKTISIYLLSHHVFQYCLFELICFLRIKVLTGKVYSYSFEQVTIHDILEPKINWFTILKWNPNYIAIYQALKPT